MRISPISNFNLQRTNRSVKTRVSDVPQTNSQEQTAQAFKGLKGAGVGTGVGLIAGGLMLLAGGPFLAPIAGTVLWGTTGLGALTGHVTESETKKNEKK